MYYLINDTWLVYLRLIWLLVDIDVFFECVELWNLRTSIYFCEPRKPRWCILIDYCFSLLNWVISLFYATLKAWLDIISIEYNLFFELR